MYIIYRTETFAKLFFIVSFTGLFMYVALAFYSFHTAYSSVPQIDDYQEQISKLQYSVLEPKLLKYILVWQVSDKINIQKTQEPFINYNCPDVNCYITSNRSFLRGNYSNFDAIIFDMSVEKKWRQSSLPKHRAPFQKYVFYSMLPANFHPICNVIVNNFFNWTWTYKLSSDIFNPFIEVKNCYGNVVGPNKNVVWPRRALTEEQADVNEINTKTRAVVWIMKDCKNKTRTNFSITKLRLCLENLGLELDIFGCGHQVCPEGGCLNAVQKDYYFYVVYEPSMSEDYVTDEVVDAYMNDAVPILIGGADYTKYLPANSYISHKGYNETTLAKLIGDAVMTPPTYREYFRWKKVVTIQKATAGQGYCKLCTLLNDHKKYHEYSNYENFRKWWYPGPLKERCIQKGAERYSEIFYYFNASTINLVK